MKYSFCTWSMQADKLMCNITLYYAMYACYALFKLNLMARNGNGSLWCHLMLHRCGSDCHGLQWWNHFLIIHISHYWNLKHHQMYSTYVCPIMNRYIQLATEKIHTIHAHTVHCTMNRGYLVSNIPLNT